MHYVAETHENLHHVLVFLTLTGATPGADVEAEVVLLPPDDATEGQGSSHLVIRNGSNTSLPLAIPAHTPPGKREVKAQSGHYEIKLMTVSKATSTAKEDPPPFLDATQLASANPTSFICASCSLPMVQSTKIEVYRDLPSEHWEELVEAWMCHTDQKLHDQVVKHGQRGFWPEPKQALVGGSYILFEESSITRNNLHLAEGPRVCIIRLVCFFLFFFFPRTTKKTDVGTVTNGLQHRSLETFCYCVSVSSKPHAGFGLSTARG